MEDKFSSPPGEKALAFSGRGCYIMQVEWRGQRQQVFPLREWPQGCFRRRLSFVLCPLDVAMRGLEMTRSDFEAPNEPGLVLVSTGVLKLW